MVEIRPLKISFTATIGSDQPSEGASDIVVSPTGTTAYVSQSGINGVGVVWVVDLTDDSVTGSIRRDRRRPGRPGGPYGP